MATSLKNTNSKLSMEAIHKFQYYRQDIIPEVQSQATADKLFQRMVVSKSITLLIHKSKTQGQFHFDYNTIVKSLNSCYFSNKGSSDITKITQTSFSKKMDIGGSLLRNSESVSEVVEYVVFDRRNTTNVHQSNCFEVYIVHHCLDKFQSQESTVKWLHFVEKYEISTSEIQHSIIATISSTKRLLNWGCKVATFEQFLKCYCLLDSFQGCLLQFAGNIKEKSLQINDPAFNDEHKVTKKIPMQYLKLFYAFKTQFGEHNEKDIGRYMIANNFQEASTREALLEYFKWKKNITEKYTWEDFAQFDRMGIFKYIGEDYMGRPVIFNKSNALKVNQVDIKKYCDFFLYFLQIYVPSKMRGNIYQMVIIGDAADVTSENYKLTLTKNNILDGLKYCAQRQYKLVAVNTGTFGYYFYKLVKPIIPKRSQDKIIGLGSNKAENKDYLLQLMSQYVIPTLLGGKNSSI